MSFLDHIAACNSHDLARFQPLLVAGAHVGWVRHDMVYRLRGFDSVFTLTERGLALSDRLDHPEARSLALDEVCDQLARDGGPRPRGERYAVSTRWGEEPLMTIDRALVSLFGVRAYGIHVNGVVRGAHGGLGLWIAKRAVDKAVAPGKLDNLVAGGQPAHLGLMDNLVKEAAEEADIPEALARTARPVGVVSYCLEDEWGLKPDTMFCFDLDVPADFEPRCTDGEIESFRLMGLDEVAARVRDTRDFKYNVNLVIIDFLIRHGRIAPDHEPDYVAIAQGLRQAL